MIISVGEESILDFANAARIRRVVLERAGFSTEYVAFQQFMVTAYFAPCFASFIHVIGHDASKRLLRPGCFIHPAFAMMIPQLATTSASLFIKVGGEYREALRFSRELVEALSLITGNAVINIRQITIVPPEVEPSVDMAITTEKPITPKPPTPTLIL